MDFPRFSYSPLRPQTTIAIDHVKRVSNETQPNVKIIVIFCANLQNDFNLYHTGNGQLLCVSHKVKIKGLMSNTGSFTPIAERIESLKAGIIGGLCLLFAFGITAGIDFLVFTPYWQLLSYNHEYVLDLRWILSAAFAGFSGFLFAITYRYVIRQDENSHLKSGAVLAFGLVRGLTQIDMSLNLHRPLIPAIALATESVLCFFFTAKCLDLSIKLGWLKPFTGDK